MTQETRPCARCGRDIPAERIEALPETEICVPCSLDIGAEYVVVPVAERSSKANSLKHNVSSYTLKKVRRRIVPIARKD